VLDTVAPAPPPEEELPAVAAPAPAPAPQAGSRAAPPEPAFWPSQRTAVRRRAVNRW